MVAFLFDYGPVMLVAAVVAAALAAARLLLRDPLPPPERRTSLLPANDLEFYRVLRQSAGDRWSIQVMVGVIDLLRSVHAGVDTRGRLGPDPSQHVDFVLCDPETMEPRVAIVLYDSTEDSAESRPDGGAWETSLAGAGLRLLKVARQEPQDVEQLRGRMEEAAEA